MVHRVGADLRQGAEDMIHHHHYHQFHHRNGSDHDSVATGSTRSPHGRSGLSKRDCSSSSFDSSQHEVAASVLLLAASAMQRQEQRSKMLSMQQTAMTASKETAASAAREDSDDGEDEEEMQGDSHENSVPLKKRKKAQSTGAVDSIMRKKKLGSQEHQQQPPPATIDVAVCHVSPHSETSATAVNKHHHDHDAPSPRSAGSSQGTPGLSSAAPHQDTPTSTNSRSSHREGGTGAGRHSAGRTRASLASEQGTPLSSYDSLKDGHPLPDSAKINDAKEITLVHRRCHPKGPPTHVEIPHFPSVLHAVLTESEFANSVLQWLPHGQSWRIVRWDALRRQVLPKYFSQLREEDCKDGTGQVCGSIDAFLWHLSAWGFEEVTDGPDVGAYSHVVRLE